MQSQWFGIINHQYWKKVFKIILWSSLLSHAWNEIRHPMKLPNINPQEVPIKSSFKASLNSQPQSKYLSLGCRFTWSKLLDLGLISLTIYIFSSKWPKTYYTNTRLWNSEKIEGFQVFRMFSQDPGGYLHTTWWGSQDCPRSSTQTEIKM